MKKLFFQRLLILVIAMAMVFGIYPASWVLAKKSPAPPAPVPGDKIVIALDAGHFYDYVNDISSDGAYGICDQNNEYVYEAEVNWVVREELEELLSPFLKPGTVEFFEVPQYESRSDRVAAAEEAGADILISIHHNGSTDISVDYTEVFITQKKVDLPLAKAISPALTASLNNLLDPDLYDAGITSTGFGMTVFGDHPAVLTEAYFITNPAAACDFIKDQDRVTAEAEGLLNGIIDYFGWEYPES